MNTLRTTVLLGALTALLVWGGDMIGGTQGAIIALIFAGAMNFFSYWYSDRVVMTMYRGQEIGPQQDPELYGLVQDLAQRGGLPMPRVFVIPQEGSMLWVDCLGLPSKRPLKAATIAFLDFINRPDIAAMNAQQAWISTPNSTAFQQLPMSTQQDPELYPSAAILSKSDPFKALSQSAYTLRLRMMNQLTLDASKE